MINEFVKNAKAYNASDIHLVCGLTPRIRVDGEIRELSRIPLSMHDCRELAGELLGREPGQLQKHKEWDMAVTIEGVRCRVNLFKQQEAWSVAIRLLNESIPRLEELGLPSVVTEFPRYNCGLVLVTGETGSGKSTTLAWVLEQINQNEAKHILTLEDPVEYVYSPKRCVINQREVGRDTDSFADGLRAALREDPDVILVGEMRDMVTIETALTAAETGHLVFGTVHTNSAADTVDRIVGVFPAERQQQIRMQLSMTLQAVVCQQLLPKVGGGRVAACEVMKVNGAIQNLIREGKTPQIINAIQTGGNIGNVLMDKCLEQLWDTGKISPEVYQAALRDKSLYKSQGRGTTRDMLDPGPYRGRL